MRTTWPTTSPTLAAQPVIIQEDSSSVTLSISGAGFGDAVGALQSASVFASPPNPTQNTPYFVLTDATQGFNAGNSIDKGGNPIALRWTWSDSNVSVQLPTPKFFSCDNLRFTIWNPADGNSVSGSTTLPGPADLGIYLPQVVPANVPITAGISVIAAPDTVLLVNRILPSQTAPWLKLQMTNLCRRSAF